MNFDSLLSKYEAKACIVSVEFYPDDTYGNIRVVAGNQAHCDDMAALGHPFVPGSPYETCFPKNQNFEDYCYRSIRNKKPLHAYVDLYTMGLWLNMFLIPLESDTPNIGYCIYVYDVSPKADTASMTDLSGDIASNVLKACIRLRRSDDRKKTFREVTEDIREICDSERCCILLVDDEKRSCTILGDALKKGTRRPPHDELHRRVLRHYLDMAIDLSWQHLHHYQRRSRHGKIGRTEPLMGKIPCRGHGRDRRTVPAAIR